MVHEREHATGLLMELNVLNHLAINLQQQMYLARLGSEIITLAKCASGDYIEKGALTLYLRSLYINYLPRQFEY